MIWKSLSSTFRLLLCRLSGLFIFNFFIFSRRRFFLSLSLLPALLWGFSATSTQKYVPQAFLSSMLAQSAIIYQSPIFAPPPTLENKQIFYRIQHSDEIWSVRYHHDGSLSATLYWRPYYEYDWYRQSQTGATSKLLPPRPLIGMPVLIDVKPGSDQKNLFKGKMYRWQRGVIFQVQIRQQGERLTIHGSRPERNFKGFDAANLISLVLNPIPYHSIPPVPDKPTPLFTLPPRSNSY